MQLNVSKTKQLFNQNNSSKDVASVLVMSGYMTRHLKKIAKFLIEQNTNADNVFCFYYYIPVIKYIEIGVRTHF